MEPLLFETGADMSNFQWGPRFSVARYKWFLPSGDFGVSACIEQESSTPPLNKLLFRRWLHPSPHLENPWRRPCYLCTYVVSI